MSGRKRIDRELCHRLYAEMGSYAAVHRELKARGIAAIYGTVRSIINGKQDNGRKAGGRSTTSRFAATFSEDKIAKLPAVNNPALTEKRTIYPHTVVHDLAEANILKSGVNASKIGGVVRKGKWKGMPIYTLTLEERATCPTSCRHWRSCFGNKMQFAHRLDHTAPEFEDALVRHVVRLGREHPRGFVVRLHVLGDFYSVRYVNLWEALLDTVPALNVFGYTARWDAADPIASALIPMVRDRWDRFAVRFSDGPMSQCTTVSLEHPIQKPTDAIVCPEQDGGKTESCSTCAFCWQSKRRVGVHSALSSYVRYLTCGQK